MLARTPACSAGTSTATLSVSSVTTTSSAPTASPGFLSHWPTTASVTDSPMAGTRISTGMLHPHGGRLARPLCLGGQDIGECIRHQARLFGGMHAGRTDGRAGPLGTADIGERQGAVEQVLQPRGHESPGAHVLRFLLQPDHLAQVRIRGDEVLDLLDR